MGSCFAMASLIWEIDSWNLAKQSGIYFAVACIVMLPIAYFMNWMKHDVFGILSYAGVFVAIFLVVWLVQFFVWKAKVRKINGRLSKGLSDKQD